MGASQLLTRTARKLVRVSGGGGGGPAPADAGLKPLRRAAEKALLCYGGDVSRLLDLCRARVRCASVAALAACLATLQGDTTLAVVRVKNWMSAQHDPRATGGFRVSEPSSPHTPTRPLQVGGARRAGG